MKKIHLLPMSALVLSLSCGGTNTDTSGNIAACAESKNDEIRLLLASNCQNCHGAGTNKPFFASLAAFENLLVYNPDYIKPGDPDASRLIQLLEGTGEGLYKQMPPSGDTFAALAEKGETKIDMAALRDWVKNLSDLPISANPDLSTPSTRRLTAEEIIATLLDQIGLVWEEDFVQSYGNNYQSPTVVLKGQLPAYSPDAAPPSHYAGDHGTRFHALGGPGFMDRRPRDPSISPTFLQTLVQVSQAWCQMAVKKPDNKVFFAKVTSDKGSADGASDIRANIAYLYLRMLGEPPGDDDTSRIYNEVFLKYEPEGLDVAWTAVCSAFVRHPLWISY